MTAFRTEKAAEHVLKWAEKSAAETEKPPKSQNPNPRPFFILKLTFSPIQGLGLAHGLSRHQIQGLGLGFFFFGSQKKALDWNFKNKIAIQGVVMSTNRF